jgi:hypothetical protein
MKHFMNIGKWSGKFALACGVAAFLACSAASVSAQSMKLESGTLDFLKGQTVLNVEYVYDGLTVGKETEQAYMEKRMTEANKKEATGGEKWQAGWKEGRAKRFEPKFEELLNKQWAKKDVKAGKNPEAKYTLVLKTTNLDPGWNAGIMRSPASVSTEAHFYDTKDRSKSLAVISIKNAPGRDAMGYDFDATYRLQEGYAKTGKELGSFILKKALK